jgi:hypothetical protein
MTATPSQSARPSPCPEHFYNPVETSSYSCLECPKGYYCSFDATTYTIQDCGYGYVCNPNIKKQQISQTQFCSLSAETESLTRMLETCYQTSFCSIGSYCHNYQRRPCPSGYYCNERQNSISNIKKCSEGFFCPEGSSEDKVEECGLINDVILDNPEKYYCPEGTSERKIAKDTDENNRGEYTTSGNRQYNRLRLSHVLPCEENKICKNGVMFDRINIQLNTKCKDNRCRIVIPRDFDINENIMDLSLFDLLNNRYLNDYTLEILQVEMSSICINKGLNNELNNIFIINDEENEDINNGNQIYISKKLYLLEKPNINLCSHASIKIKLTEYNEEPHIILIVPDIYIFIEFIDTKPRFTNSNYEHYKLSVISKLDNSNKIAVGNNFICWIDILEQEEYSELNPEVYNYGLFGGVIKCKFVDGIQPYFQPSIPMINEKNGWIKISAGIGSVCGVSFQNDIMCFGTTQNGLISNIPPTIEMFDLMRESLSLEEKEEGLLYFRDVISNYDTNCAIQMNGKVLCWYGNNYDINIMNTFFSNTFYKINFDDNAFCGILKENDNFICSDRNAKSFAPDTFNSYAISMYNRETCMIKNKEDGIYNAICWGLSYRNGDLYYFNFENMLGNVIKVIQGNGFVCGVSIDTLKPSCIGNLRRIIPDHNNMYNVEVHEIDYYGNCLAIMNTDNNIVLFGNLNNILLGNYQVF